MRPVVWLLTLFGDPLDAGIPPALGGSVAL